MQIGPAAAQGAGTTTSGYSNINKVTPTMTVPLCLQPDANTTIKLFNVGTMNGGPSNPNNDLKTTADFTQDPNVTYYFGPGGTYSDPSCTMPYAVPGTLSVSGNVKCDATNATYQRIGTQYTIMTTNPTICSSAQTVVPTEHDLLVYTGTQQACQPTGPDPCGGGSQSQEFAGSYTQAVVSIP